METQERKGEFKVQYLVAVVVSALLLLSAVQAVQISNLKQNIVSGEEVRAQNSAPGGAPPVPVAAQRPAPTMVGGC